MQFGDRLTDLDELLLRCRNPQSKVFMREAIDCYRAGAYRSAIISTWIAVVFDLIEKWKELALSGDVQAEKIMDELQKMYLTDNLADALKFERGVLEKARNDFQLFSFIEEEDLKRLFDDRNRCAHPSLRSLDEPYQPSSELVRSHIYNAVSILLQHPPIQGRKALQSILDTINSNAFPVDVDRALNQYFNHSPLVRPRPTLIKDVLAVLSKDLILQPLSDAEYLRKSVALQAVLKMHHQEGASILEQELPKILARNLDDFQLAKVVSYIKVVPTAWYALGNPGRDKIQYFFERDNTDSQMVTVLPIAMSIPALQQIASQRMSRLSNEYLAQIIAGDPQPQYYLIEALGRWKKTTLFEESKTLTKQFLAPFLTATLTSEDLTKIILACSENSQLYEHFITIRIMRTEVFPLSEACQSETKDAWLQLYKCYHAYYYPDKLDTRMAVGYEQSMLISLIETRYADAADIVKNQLRKEHDQMFED